MSERGDLNANDMAFFARRRAQNRARYYDAVASLHMTRAFMTGAGAAVTGFLFAQPLSSYHAVQELGSGPGIVTAVLAGLFAATSVNNVIDAGVAMRDAEDMRS